MTARDARRTNVRIGTASWTDRSLLESGRWYPDDVTSPEERLRYYASRFDFVEVDSTYYTADFEKQARAWAERTPSGFVFDVKAFRTFTLHQTPHKMLPRAVRDDLGEPPEGKRNWYYRDLPVDVRDELWTTFERSLRPLVDAKKLGAIVLQSRYGRYRRPRRSGTSRNARTASTRIAWRSSSATRHGSTNAGGGRR
jgi:uncharacterized protein YecE (DUF72 family)